MTIRSPLLVTLALAGATLFGGSAKAQVVAYDPILYGDLAARWQQYVLAIPFQANPIADTAGTHALVAQSGPCYFLVGSFSTEPVDRTVRIPAGTFLFFPLVTVECSTVEAAPFHGSNYTELSQCAASFFHPTDVLSCTIDGLAVGGLQGYRAQSPLYGFSMPPRNNILGLNGVRGGLSVADGYWLLLEPLPAGHHEIHFTALLSTGIGAGFTQDITYHITVD